LIKDNNDIWLENEAIFSQTKTNLRGGGISLSYKPEPIDTANVILSKDILELTEMLARNTHEVWARARLEEGWHLGPHRDDAKKEHPCLVTYEELPDSEKEYDRKTAMETIKAIIALGYHIGK
jgi:hypothetical protein